jgi:transposase-like protein
MLSEHTACFKIAAFGGLTPGYVSSSLTISLIQTKQIQMVRRRRTFSMADKRKIIEEAAKQGVGKILETYQLSYSVYSRWKQLLQEDVLVLENEMLQTRLSEISKENERLKRIIADLMLAKEIRTENDSASGKNPFH